MVLLWSGSDGGGGGGGGKVVFIHQLALACSQTCVPFGVQPQVKDGGP